MRFCTKVRKPKYASDDTEALHATLHAAGTSPAALEGGDRRAVVPKVFVMI